MNRSKQRLGPRPAGRADKNSVYALYGVVENWYQVDYNGTVGFIFGDLASEVLPGNV